VIAVAPDTSATPQRQTETAVNNGVRVIVVGLDGSPTSWDAFAWAAGVAARGNGRLVAVHVMPFTEPAAVFGTQAVGGHSTYPADHTQTGRR